MGEISPPPRESPLRRDPEVHFESPAHPLGFRFLPGRGLPANAVTVETAAMAAPRQVPSHTVPRKPSCSTDSSFTRTPVPTVSLGSRELPVSPWQVAEPSSKNLWEQICDGRQPGLAERGGTRVGAAFEERPLCAWRLTGGAAGQQLRGPGLLILRTEKLRLGEASPRLRSAASNRHR